MFTHGVSYRTFILVFTMLGGILSGCGGNARHSDTTLVEEYVAKGDKDEEIAKINQEVFARANMNIDPSDYLLGSGDLLQMEVFEAQNLNSKVRVSSRGYITLPLLGEVKVKGLSAREAEIKIEELYRAKYIKDPHISIFVEEHFSQRVTVVGQVKEPGTYDYFSKQRLLDVLALAGGLNDSSGRSVQIRRVGTTPGENNVVIVDLDRLIKEGSTQLNIEINGGDIIFVPEAGVFFADGAVRKPGPYRIKQKTSLNEAIMEAGGFAPYATKNQEVTLIRRLDTGEREILKLNLEEQPEGQDIEIQDRDVIIVEASGWGKFVHGTGFNLGIPGILGFGYRNPER
jgi:polysaccharide biosynthesis/export protein